MRRTEGVTPSASANDLTPQNRRTDMPSIKPVEEASQEFTADLAALRDDVTKLTSSVSKFIRTQTTATTNTVFDAAKDFRPGKQSARSCGGSEHGPRDNDRAHSPRGDADRDDCRHPRGIAKPRAQMNALINWPTTSDSAALPPSPGLPSVRPRANGTSACWLPSPSCRPASLRRSSMAPRLRTSQASFMRR